jgi:nicotinate-nucleotide adenylyltransferase
MPDESCKKLQTWVNEVYVKTFGQTPLSQRLQDILNEAIELSRYMDIKNLREEAGDLMGSLLQLYNECGWTVPELIHENLTKIQARSLQYLSLGRKTSVALLGGAFDPPSLGHIQVAKFVLNTSKTFDEAWLVPCFSHLYNKKMADASWRATMCDIACHVDPRIKISTFELDKKLRGETYHMVKMLLKEPWAKDKYDFSVVIGMDNANSFDKWVNFEELERMIRFVIVPRKGIIPDPKVNWYLKPPHIYLTGENPPQDISSTQVRTILKGLKRYPAVMPKALNGLLDPEVYHYIKLNNLYR